MSSKSYFCVSLLLLLSFTTCVKCQSLLGAVNCYDSYTYPICENWKFLYGCTEQIKAYCRYTCKLCSPTLGETFNTQPEIQTIAPTTSRPLQATTLTTKQTTATTATTSTEETFEPRLMSLRVKNMESLLNNFKSTVEQRLVNISLIINSLTGTPGVSENYVQAIIQTSVEDMKNDIVELKARPIYNATFTLKASHVSLLVNAKLNPIHKQLAEIRSTLKDLKRLIIPTVEAACNSNGKLSYSQKFIAICPTNCNVAPYSVWGTGTYTTDSNICASAIHDGLIDAYGGQVMVIRIAGRLNYFGSNRNNISSSNFNEDKVSIRFELP